LSIGLVSAAIAACVGIICLRRLARYLNEQAKRMTGLALCVLGSTCLLLFALIVVH
jgi:putative Mn2+ efflux pump MntP